MQAGDWKLLHGQDTVKEAKGGKRKHANTAHEEYQLYNLAVDVGEKNNLAESNPKSSLS